jgi:xanthine dehydrogenase accessory factor
MAFHDTLYDDFVDVDGIRGVLAETVLDIAAVLASPGRVAVTPLQLIDLMVARKLDALIDARMQKYRITPDLRKIAEITVGLGPDFLTGFNCDVAIETHPSGTGGVVENGMTMAPDDLARNLGVAGKERFVYSQRDGLWRTPVDVGARVYKGITLGHHAGVPVFAPIDGFLHGIARDGTMAPKGVKLIEIDPRGRAAAWTGPDERGLAIA